MSDHKSESHQECVALDMANGIEAAINYQQKFVQHPNPNKPGPTNAKAKVAPSKAEVLKGME